MKKFFFILVSVLLLSCAGSSEKQVKKEMQIIEVQKGEKIPEKVQESLKVFDEFFDELRGELVSAINKSGTDGAIRVCKKVSPDLEKKYSVKYNMKVYRISDKYRNPQHKPTEDEQKVLEFWSKKLSENKPIQPVYYELGEKTKVMKPIKIFAELCLQCHGNLESMNPKLKEALKKEYPDDKAYNYKMDDLRGSFVAEF